MQASQARVDAAISRADEVKSALYPQLRLSGRIAQLSEVPEFSLTLPFVGQQTLFPSITRNYAAKLSLQQNIFSGFRVAKSAEAAESQQTAVQHEFTRDREDLILNVVTAYWNLYRARRVETVLAQSVEQVSAHANDVENFKKQGMATDLDLLKVQTQLSDITVKHIETQSNVRLATMALNILTGVPLQTRVIPADESSMQSDSGPLELERVMQLARERRAEVSAVTARRDAARATVGVAQGGWYPQIVLAANYDYARPNQRIIPPKDAWEKSWDVGLLFQWNIWDWFATAKQEAQAKAGLSQAEAALLQVSDAVALDAAQNFFRAAEGKEKINVASLGLKQAEESYRITSEKFKRGLASNTDLLDAELALLQARLTATQAVVEHAIQIQKLNRSVGVPLQ
jgi:outer membrane protein TolC